MNTADEVAERRAEIEAAPVVETEPASPATSEAETVSEPITIAMTPLDAAMVGIRNANDFELKSIVMAAFDRISTDELANRTILEMLAGIPLDMLEMLASQLPHLIRNRKDADLVADQAEIANQMAA